MLARRGGGGRLRVAGSSIGGSSWGGEGLSSGTELVLFLDSLFREGKKEKKEKKKKKEKKNLSNLAGVGDSLYLFNLSRSDGVGVLKSGRILLVPRRERKKKGKLTMASGSVSQSSSSSSSTFR